MNWRQAPHTTRNAILSNGNIKNYSLKMPTFGFIAGKSINRKFQIRQSVKNQRLSVLESQLNVS